VHVRGHCCLVFGAVASYTRRALFDGPSDPSNPTPQPNIRNFTTSAPMDDIHAPTVSSGPTTAGYTNGVRKEQLSLQEQIAEKDRLEEELKALGQVLDSVSTLCIAQYMTNLSIAWCQYEHYSDYV
jgi:hypothetical protein